MKGLLFSFLLLPLISFSQKLGNLKASMEGEKVIISFDLGEGYRGDKFNISVYSSHNNYSTPLLRIIGDFGTEVPPGTGKRIEWDAKNEIGNYRGELSFEIRAEVVGAFILTDGISSAKRGKSTPIKWRGGSLSQNVKIELLKGGTSVGPVETVSNSGSYLWAVPPKQKTGSGYQLRLINGKNEITSEPFAIKYKVPLLVKVIPVAVLGAVIALSGGSKSSAPAPAKNLALPPDLGLN
jgi:hypothetical protein